MELYQSLATVLTTTFTDSPIDLISSQLTQAPSDQKTELARILAELLRSQTTSGIIINTKAHRVLHEYIHHLISIADLNDGSKFFGIAVELADEEILLEILADTARNLDDFLSSVRRLHKSHDDGFAVDFEGFLESHLGRFEEATKLLGLTMDQNSPHHVQVQLGNFDPVIRHLRFWHFLFIMAKILSQSSVYEKVFRYIAMLFPPTLLAVMAIGNYSLAKAASDTLCCFVNDFHGFLLPGTSEILWDGIHRLVDAQVHVDLALALWLRCVASREVKPTQDILENDKYWVMIQKCLVTGFSERRKYSLHLLIKSISLITGAINTQTLFFEPEKRMAIAAAWTKYSTLVEITSLSTSPNQLRDAIPDFNRLLDSTSYIPASWLAALITLGFRSGSGGVSRIFWNILLPLEQGRLKRLFQVPEARELLEEILLPYAATASNFIIKPSHPETCEHGSQVTCWLANILCSSSPQTRKLTARAILMWIDAKDQNIFAPARAWILKGVMEGLEGEVVFDSTNDINLLVRIAKMQRFTKPKIDICVAIVLKLFLAVDLNKVQLHIFWAALSEVSWSKQHLLSVQYVEALQQKLQKCQPGSVLMLEILQPVTMDTVVQPESTPRAVLMRAVLAIYVYCMSLRENERGLSFDTGFLANAFESSNISLDCWILLLKNEDLFRFVEKYLFNEYSLAVILENHASSHKNSSGSTNIATLLKLWPVKSFEASRKCNYQDFSYLRTFAKSRWDNLFGACPETFELRVEQARTQWISICAESARLFEKTPEEISSFISVDQALLIINSYALPILGRNKHENIEMTVTAEKFLESSFRVLSAVISEKVDPTTVAEILRALPRLLRFLENESLLEALNVIRTLATKTPRQFIEFLRHQGDAITRTVNLGHLLLRLWEIVDAATLRSDLSKIYHSFVETIFHSAVIEGALENESLREAISTISMDIIKLGSGKRSIKPAIAKEIRNSFLHTPEYPKMIGRSQWLVDIVIELINYKQNLKDMDYVLEHPLATAFDKITPEKNHYEEYYGEREFFAQVYVFDMLARMNENEKFQAGFVKSLREKIFLPWTENFHGMTVWTPWKKQSQLQTLILLERAVQADEAEQFLNLAINKALCHEPHPRYRFMFEWIISLCIIRHPQHRNRIWKHLQYSEDQNPKLQVSLLKIALMTARALDPSIREEYFIELVYTAIPLTSNSKVVVRHQAVAMMLELWDDAVKFGFTSLTNNPIFSRVHRGVLTSPYYKEYSDAKDFRTFDAIKNMTLIGIFSGAYLIGGDDVEIISSTAFRETMAQDYRDVNSIPECRLRIELGDLAEPKSNRSYNGPVHSGKVEYKQHDAEILKAVSIPIQTKGNRWELTIDPGDRTEQKNSDQDIVVIASLLDNPINLGGVSRVSEIMGVKTLTLANKLVTRSSEFASVSVHSEAWLDILEVPILQITSYLREMRVKGYLAVGIEQTDRSVVIGEENNWKFPKKTVLLLGTEKFGIPAELLGELDCCVEIPQKGMTRSMNVQTAAAVVLYEVTRQLRQG